MRPIARICSRTPPTVLSIRASCKTNNTLLHCVDINMNHANQQGFCIQHSACLCELLLPFDLNMHASETWSCVYSDRGLIECKIPSYRFLTASAQIWKRIHQRHLITTTSSVNPFIFFVMCFQLRMQELMI